METIKGNATSWLKIKYKVKIKETTSPHLYTIEVYHGRPSKRRRPLLHALVTDIFFLEKKIVGLGLHIEFEHQVAWHLSYAMAATGRH